MFSYTIINTPSFDIDNKTVDNIFKSIWKAVEKHQKWVLNIVFLDAEGIKKLNKEYRMIDKITDILSFHYYDDFENVEEQAVSWEIILCEEKVIEQWEIYKLWTQWEFYKLIIHWILHILWYDHEQDDDYKIMNELEKKIWTEVFGK